MRPSGLESGADAGGACGALNRQPSISLEKGRIQYPAAGPRRPDDGRAPSTVPGLPGHSETSSGYRGAELLREVLEVVDPYTGDHSRAVVDLSVAVTEVMDLDADRRRDVEYAAMLHDVGKIRVPTQIINKPDRLDEAEWELMRRHTLEGESMLEQLGGTLAAVGRFVRSSHERYDGRGYPDGLAGEQIPIESRIVCVCEPTTR